MMRRARYLAFALASSALLAAGAPAIGEPYQPQDEDERGLWMQTEEMERELKTSDFLMRQTDLNDYLHQVLCRTVGDDECSEARIYLTRTPYFNASMAPNGMMQVWSGLLLRIQNEAQLAAVLGHEYGHYQERHSLRLFRNIKDKSNAASWLGFVPFGWVAQMGLGLSVYSFNREMEREADRHSLDFLVAAGYDPNAAANIWRRLNDEMDATAGARKQKSRKNKNGGLFATHPTNDERIENLTEQAASYGDVEGEVGAEAYREALAPYWTDLVDDQLKLNDFGATEFLLTSLSEYQGWTAPLLYARAELYRRRAAEGDLHTAIGFYRQALLLEEQMPALHRGFGLALIKNGEAEEGQAQLRAYLASDPDAHDHAMIAMMAGGEGW